MTRICYIILAVFFFVGASAQKRYVQYFPDGEGWTCVNGKNCFTRALYGGPSEFRIESSDRPVFATYKKGACHSIVFHLDSTSYCKSTYLPGRRDYILKDNQWAGAEIQLSVLAFADEEGGVWRFVSDGFSSPQNIIARISDIKRTKLHRNGDMGVDAPDAFCPSDNNVYEVKASLKDTLYFVFENQKMRLAGKREGRVRYARAEAYRQSVSGRISFHTPDPYINNLGGALCIAADGDWDGDTWLHGCIGWRIPLAGWRAGYVADLLGWDSRAVNHFNAYAQSQLTDVPCIENRASQDSAQNLARSVQCLGTPMYSNGYICRYPHHADKTNYYDMNLNYIDAMLWHFCWNADTSFMRRMWPVLTRHLAWEKKTFDPDNDALYDAYCCIWASDGLYYNSGAVTHSSAYNYRANKMASRIAEILGYDPSPYRDEASRILHAMNTRLWMPDEGVWAEYQDFMGLRRLHTSPALWTVYEAIDCGTATKTQAEQACDWVSRNIPHIDVKADGLKDEGWQTVSTSNWMPYDWSINNVAPAEVMNMALAYFEAGRKADGFRLMKSNILDQMYLGNSPANFGQLSFYDAARGECYRDFGDVIGISARTIIQGLFGVYPDALHGKCVIRPGFPDGWDSVAFHSSYLDYTYLRHDSVAEYSFRQRFAQPLAMELITDGKILSRKEYDDVTIYKVLLGVDSHDVSVPFKSVLTEVRPDTMLMDSHSSVKMVDMAGVFNAHVNDIFRNSYTSPASPYTTLRIPKQGIGEWCTPQKTAEINDSVFRAKLVKNTFDTGLGVKFRSPSSGNNIAYTSLWDNYPDSVDVKLSGKASHVCLLMAGSTNPMQSRIANGIVVVTYKDGTRDSLLLINPDNWCPIEQDYYVDGKAFYVHEPRPYRVHFGSGIVSRDLEKVFMFDGADNRIIPSGAAEILDMPLNPRKSLRMLTVKTLSNDVVIGLMAVSLQ